MANGIYASDGTIRTTTVSGSSWTGLYAADGSYNIVLDDSSHTGLYHPCGAWRVNSGSNPNQLTYDPSGAYYLSTLLGTVNGWQGNIVAWGDSLTAGGTTKYPAVAQSLFTDGRTVVNKGIGGQTSTQIAARQGGVPITVTLDGDDINAKDQPIQTWAYTFDSTVEGWTNIAGAGTLASVSGQLVRDGATESTGGSAVALGKTIPSGNTLGFSFDLVAINSPTTLRAALYSSTGGGGTTQSTTVDYSTTGTKTGTLTVNSASALAFGLRFNGNTAAKSFTIDNVTLNEYGVYTADSVTAKSVNILVASGAFTGTSVGSLQGVSGTMNTDVSGNWTFTRSSSGAAVSCPAGSTFTPDDAATYKNQIAWFWAGRNNVADPTTIKSDIAAMVSFIGHQHYLVMSVLTSASDSAGTITSIQSLNSDLAATYGNRFVDVLTMLQANGDGSANDNADIAAGLVPRSLRIDDTHLTATGYTLVGQQMYQKTISMRG